MNPVSYMFQGSAPQFIALFHAFWKFAVHLLMVSLVWLCCTFEFVYRYWRVWSFKVNSLILTSPFFISSPSTTILTTSRYSKSSCLYSGTNHHIVFRRAKNNFNCIPDEMIFFFLMLNFLTLKIWGTVLYHHPESTVRSIEPGQSRWHGDEMDLLFGGQAGQMQEAFPIGALIHTTDSSPFTLLLQIFPPLIVITIIERGQFGRIFSKTAESNPLCHLLYIIPLFRQQLMLLFYYRVSCSKMFCWNSSPGFPVYEEGICISLT